MGKKLGPYSLKGENEESVWEGHKITGRHWGTPIGELKVEYTFSEDWAIEEGTLKPKLLGVKGKYYMKRVKACDEEVVYEGFSKMMGFKTPLKMIVRRSSLVTVGTGKAEDVEEARSKLEISPVISDEDWAEFLGQAGKKSPQQ
jgi:hypothetical protein